MSGQVEGLFVLLVAYAIVIVIFIYPQLFNKLMLFIHREHRKWGLAPKDPRSYTARPLLIRMYMIPFIIIITWMFYLLLTGHDM